MFFKKKKHKNRGNSVRKPRKGEVSEAQMKIIIDTVISKRRLRVRTE